MKICHYAIIDYSQEMYMYLLDRGYQLYMKSQSDFKFMENVYKILVSKMG